MELPHSDSKYQVYFFSCPAHIPFHFALHLWIVTVGPTGITRFEVLHSKRTNVKHYGYVYLNYCPATRGLRRRRGSKEFWKSKLLGSITGDDKSLAEQMVNFIHNYSKDYPYKDTYRIFPGPNSNSYVGWILSQFPEAQINIPWNALGKNYCSILLSSSRYFFCN